MKFEAKLVLTVLYLLLATTDSCKYKKFSEDHSFCKEPNEECDLQESEVTEADKKMILKTHNEFRMKIATGNESGMPKASNMMEIVWDDELASIAQKWADQCTFRHDCFDCRKVERFPVGQNIYTISSTGRAESGHWKEMTEGFYEEVKDFDKNVIKSFKPNSAYGHFTQLAWAETWLIGCGEAVYKKDGENKSLLVCNYGPTGNIEGAEMYKEGEPCSDCPSGTCCCNKCEESGVTSDYHGLCKVIDEEQFKMDNKTE
ncbi:CRISP/Allergen/PR-1-like [Argiope bruennichi]|uniref:CRISP/Allergen/PR-1 like protein n=1 Tax=Argiope bruennichi TaxID=94029 RepID=A0A8T0E3D0_ARGBR|nr:CRISP/Allergen/PR-1-like [Argiope bruennichi]KAF8764846.1 CRISP/Allergen/PR-1 like protein [Argiope bruennichi]